MEYIEQKEKTKIIIYKKDKVLVLEKNIPKKRYVLPGGFLKKNEQPVICLLREVMEETNVLLNTKFIKSIDAVHTIGNNNKLLKKHYYSYKCRDEDFLNIEIDKFKAIKWVSFKSASRYMNESDTVAIQHFFS
ncbi:NUDIX hydrolase [Lutibacter sp. TH_r2]|uniref:NUDIX hydrolase n=1 Tax=Lutibacter sp. TH_r2 TaxID=3082083 RepID=UPI00295440A3|nr:NUDIX hydrolase [Lutibacter sp. TH_r2]MDV7186454.1 NUDIX hydrolase [Lutibacter sp. TH_r2]